MTMRRAAAVLSIGALLVVVMAPASQGDTRRFKAVGCTENPRWDPLKRKISKGDRIVWKNPTSCDHTVSAYGRGWRKSTEVPPGGKTAKKFKRTGTYKFRCLVPGHSVLQSGVCDGMCGRVRVTR